MVISVSAAEANARARTVDVLGESYVLREYIGAAPRRGTYVDGNESNDNGQPQGFLVSQPAGTITRPHFHETNQFQVFVGGGGRFGKQPAAPLTVQYASGHTPYGPIVAGDEGVMYFTLRQRWDPGAKYMPEMRDRLQRGRQRQALTADLPVQNATDLAQRTANDTLCFLGPETDGLLGMLISVAPNARADIPDPAAGAGQYHVVVAGSMRADDGDGNDQGDRLLDRLSCQYAFSDDAPLYATAGESGLQLLVLRFPRA
ncbi:MAG: hypothetical protein ACTSQV_02395 [Alphaproteobacteria bacterium]